MCIRDSEYTVDNLMGMFQRVHLLDDSHYELERWQQIIAVSYTYLDVYKRQGNWNMTSGF